MVSQTCIDIPLSHFCDVFFKIGVTIWLVLHVPSLIWPIRRTNGRADKGSPMFLELALECPNGPSWGSQLRPVQSQAVLAV